MEGKFLRRGEDDGEPDLLYSLGGKTVGIEIATAFYHNRQAEIESHLALGKLNSGRFGTPLGVPNDQDKVILSVPRWELNEKCSNRYAGDEVWLCIHLQAPLLEIPEAEQLLTPLLFLLVTSLPASTSVFTHLWTEKVSGY